MTLGDTMRTARLAANLRQRQAATMTWVDAPLYSRFEAMREPPTRGFLRRFAEVTGADVAVLFALLDEWEPAPPIDLNAPGVFVCRRAAPSPGGTPPADTVFTLGDAIDGCYAETTEADDLDWSDDTPPAPSPGGPEGEQT